MKIIRLGNIGRDGHSLWANGLEYQLQPSKVLSKSQDPFMETLSFLQIYDPEYVGGIERVLQTASELAERRELEAINSQWPNLGTQFKVNILRGFGPQSHFHETPEGGGNPVSRGVKNPGTVQQSSFPAQITDIIWRGITNRTAMEDDTASVPSSPQVSAAGNGRNSRMSTESQETTTIWNFAGKLKDSDTVATLSKVGTNWRARGLLPSWSVTSWSTLDPSLESIRNGEDSAVKSPSNSSEERTLNSDSPLLFSPSTKSPPSGSPVHVSAGLSPPASGKLMEKTKIFMSKTRSTLPNSAPRSAPKPLLLNSSTSIVSGHTHSHSAGAGSLPTPDTDEWADVMKAKRHHFHKDSQSSITSLSPSDVFGRTPKSTRSDRESEPNSSRIVALNRRSVSPMAPAFRVSHSSPSSRNSSISSGYSSPSILTKSPLQQASNITKSEVQVHPGVLSPSTLRASLPSDSSESSILLNKYREKGSDGSDTTSNVLPIRRKTQPAGLEFASESEDTASSAPLNHPNRASRVRTKRYARPANLQIQDIQRPRISAGMKTPSPSKLVVEWPGDENESITTPRATSFDSDNSPGLSKSPRRPRKISSGDPERPKKFGADNSNELTNKVFNGSRTRKISAESRDMSRSRRESAGVEGDDEGYDELLSAYESEDGPNFSSR